MIIISRWKRITSNVPDVGKIIGEENVLLLEKHEKRNHFETVCRNNKNHILRNGIAEVFGTDSENKTWSKTRSIESLEVNFKGDIGADVNILPQK